MYMGRTLLVILAAGLLATLRAHAQAQPADTTGPESQLAAEQQIAAAVLPAPEPMRADATVLGYGSNGRLKKLRQGSGALGKRAHFHRAGEPHREHGHRRLG